MALPKTFKVHSGAVFQKQISYGINGRIKAASTIIQNMRPSRVAGLKLFGNARGGLWQIAGTASIISEPIIVGVDKFSKFKCLVTFCVISHVADLHILLPRPRFDGHTSPSNRMSDKGRNYSTVAAITLTRRVGYLFADMRISIRFVYVKSSLS